jgi:hypothetical protein
VLLPHGGENAELAAPFRVKAGESFIDVEVGHAAPLFTDFDGDGLKDLLVGQFGEGKLRVYRNVGTLGEPRFTEHKLFQAEGADGKVPTG